MNSLALWDRFQKYLCSVPSLDLTLDVSRINFADDYFDNIRLSIVVTQNSIPVICNFY